ncbi:chorismate mutase [Azospirillum sp. ST 5-10]|uniref:chorismate mutase n=1 Tax=unclassified Azospirillum TaxID=2630922 RepID=UPI003F4A7D5A
MVDASATTVCRAMTRHRLLPCLAVVLAVVAAPGHAQPARPLEEIRKDIDAADRGLLDLLNRRSAISLEVAAAKKGGAGPVYRPGRQAALMRRLAAQNEGPLPDAAAWRVWQEIIASSIGLQTDFTVAYAAPEAVSYALATGYFGAGTALTRADSAAALRGVLESGAADVAVVPLDAGGAPWWRDLPGTALRVVARLPFVPPAAGHVDAPGFVIAPYEADPSGRDRSLLVVEAAAATSTEAVAAALAPLGWRETAVLARADGDGGSSFLVEADAPPAAAGTAGAGPGGAVPGPLRRVTAVGLYAEPLAAGE